MTEITKEFIIEEMNKISFFIQHSGMFDNFTPRSKNDLESLPVEWVEVKTDGEIELTEGGQKHWKSADLKGKLKDKDLFLKIDKSPDRNIYTLVYDNGTYKTSNMSKLKSIVESLESGETPKPKYLQAVYNVLQQKKMEIRKFIEEHYLKGLSDTPWEILISKDVSRIYIKMTVDSEDPAKIIDQLKSHNFYRMDSIGQYLKHLIKKANIESEDFIFSHRFLRIGMTAGFTVSIK